MIFRCLFLNAPISHLSDKTVTKDSTAPSFFNKKRVTGLVCLLFATFLLISAVVLASGVFGGGSLAFIAAGVCCGSILLFGIAALCLFNRKKEDSSKPEQNTEEDASQLYTSDEAALSSENNHD